MSQFPRLSHIDQDLTVSCTDFLSGVSGDQLVHNPRNQILETSSLYKTKGGPAPSTARRASPKAATFTDSPGAAAATMTREPHPVNLPFTPAGQRSTRTPHPSRKWDLLVHFHLPGSGENREAFCHIHFQMGALGLAQGGAHTGSPAVSRDLGGEA